VVVQLAQECGLIEELITYQMDEERGADSLHKVIKAIKAKNKN
jgi:hypothetical protein